MAPFNGARFDSGQNEAYDPWASMPGQLYDWTCSACSLEWLKRSVGLIEPPEDIYISREITVYEIGYPHNINPQVGLTSYSGKALQEVLSEYGRQSEQDYLSFNETYEIASQGPGMMSGAAWYHWVAIRGVQGSTIWVANSAPGYKGIWNNVSREDFDRLGGFSVVWLT